MSFAFFNGSELAVKTYTFWQEISLSFVLSDIMFP